MNPLNTDFPFLEWTLVRQKWDLILQTISTILYLREEMIVYKVISQVNSISRMNPFFSLIYGTMRHDGDRQLCSRPGFRWGKDWCHCSKSLISVRCHSRNQGSSHLYGWLTTLQCLNNFKHHNYDTERALKYGNMHPKLKRACRSLADVMDSAGYGYGGKYPLFRETWCGMWIKFLWMRNICQSMQEYQ